MPTCRLCDGLEALLHAHGVERVIIQGFRESGASRWIVDVLTDAAEGHANMERLTEAVDKAIGETQVVE